MQHASSKLEDDDIDVVTRHFAGMRKAGSLSVKNGDPDLVARGEAIATGSGDESVPVFAACLRPWEPERPSVQRATKVSSPPEAAFEAA
jgi:hypothetical protein